jgi:hypothetical protein
MDLENFEEVKDTKPLKCVKMVFEADGKYYSKFEDAKRYLESRGWSLHQMYNVAEGLKAVFTQVYDGKLLRSYLGWIEVIQ